MQIDSNFSLNQLQVKDYKTKTRTDKFKEVLAQKTEEKDKELKKVSEEFESIFIGMMFKQMRDAGFKSELFDHGVRKKVYEDMYYNEIAKQAAGNTKLGIAEAVYRQLSNNS